MKGRVQDDDHRQHPESRRDLTHRSIELKRQSADYKRKRSELQSKIEDYLTNQ